MIRLKNTSTPVVLVSVLKKQAKKPQILQWNQARLMSIKQNLKDFLENKKKEERDRFQSWAEFQGRGFVRPQYMRAWIIEEYGDDIEKILKCDTLETETKKITSTISNQKAYLHQAVNSPNEVLVKVHAASLNPIDIMISRGYGAQLFNLQRNFIFKTISAFPPARKYANVTEREFPLVLGRDFSGTVVDCGTQVGDLVPGDDVYGAPSLFATGTLSDYVCVSLDHVVQKPATLSHLDATSLPYVALTVVSALQHLVTSEKTKRSVLVLGGSGGIGTFAIQYLQAFGFSVTTTCSTDGLTICNQLGANCIDYKTENVEQKLSQQDKFGVVFDVVGAAAPSWAHKFLVKGGTYTTLKSPMVNMADRYGPAMGLTSAAVGFAMNKFQNHDINVEWGFYKPNRLALLEVARMVDGGLIKPVINPNNVFDFENTPSAFKSLASGHTKGKIVINVSKLPEVTQKPDVEKIIHL